MAERLVTGLAPKRRLAKHRPMTANAIFAESVTDTEQAIKLYLQAVDHWADYGFVLEEGQAHLGLARCLIALGDREAAAEPHQRARAIISRLGAVPLLNEADNHLRSAATS
jgi:tetratricopeptide (TPR) repeat protein